MNEIIIFLLAFLTPFLYYRSLFYIYRNYFKESSLRVKSGLQIHHLHYGCILLVITSMILLFYGKNAYSIVLLGFGIGLILDEFVPALLMPGNRKLELKAYEKGFIPTLILLLVLSFIILMLYFFIQGKVL